MQACIVSCIVGEEDILRRKVLALLCECECLACPAVILSCDLSRPSTILVAPRHSGSQLLYTRRVPQRRPLELSATCVPPGAAPSRHALSVLPTFSDLRLRRRVRLPRPERLLHRDAEGIGVVVPPGARGALGSHGKQACRRSCCPQR